MCSLLSPDAHVIYGSQAFDKLCKGRGGSIPLSCNVMDWRCGDVCFYAPLLEMERKELTLFVEFNKLNT
jgi:hypothetical protein